MQPTKNPTVAFTGPYGSMTSPTCSRNDSAVRGTLRPVSLMRAATSRCRGRVKPRLLARARSFSIAFPGISISLGQTFQQAWQLVQVKRPSRTASEIRSPLVAGVEGEPHLLPHRGRPEELCHVHGRADREAAEALDAVPEGLDGIDVLLFRGD